jgi:uncharacterized protein YjcR
MTNEQNKQIKNLRCDGTSYSTIASMLDISINTVKSFCRRNNLANKYCKNICDNCGASLLHTPGAKKKRFCCDKCRMDWWAKNTDKVNRKALYNFECGTCGVDFQSYGNAYRKYCSRRCYGKSRRGLHE